MSVLDNPARTYILYDTELPWKDAYEFCRSRNSTLGRIYDLATIPDMDFGTYMGIKQFWIGLHRNTSKTWIWTDGSLTDWSNWQAQQSTNQAKCVSTGARAESQWKQMPCDTHLPFVCETKADNCEYEKTEKNSIVGRNVLTLYGESVETCETVCELSIEIECRSFEYHRQYNVCQLNSGNKWTVSKIEHMTRDDAWDYYHRRCSRGIIAQNGDEDGSSGHSRSYKQVPVSVPNKTFYQFPYAFKVFLTPTTWDQAVNKCSIFGGELAKIEALSVIPDINVDLTGSGFTEIWMGLRKKPTWSWIDGSEPVWVNWMSTYDSTFSTNLCATVKAEPLYQWRSRECQKKLPFLCQYRGDRCSFRKFEDSAVVSFNHFIKGNISVTKCLILCEDEVNFTCGGLDYYHAESICLLSTTNKWSKMQYFRSHLPGWTHFHRTCVAGNRYKPPDIPSTTEDITSTTTEITTESTPTTTDRDVRTVTICTVENSTNEKPFIFEEAIEEMKKMGETYKKRKIELTKISVYDTKSETLGVASMSGALVLTLVMMSVLCVSDMRTYFVQFKYMISNLKIAFGISEGQKTRRGVYAVSVNEGTDRRVEIGKQKKHKHSSPVRRRRIR